VDNGVPGNLTFSCTRNILPNSLLSKGLLSLCTTESTGTMPQHQSAVKRVRQNEKRRLHNKSQKSQVRTLMKKVEAAEDKAEAQSLLNEAKAGLDRLASKGIIHKNKAANYKSKLEKHVNAL